VFIDVTRIRIPGARFRAKLIAPVSEIASHFVLTVLVILSIGGTEATLGLFHLSGRLVPFFGQVFGITASDWLFALDLVSATLINVVGIYKAVVVLWRS
jgi:hypothetical protein